MIVIALIITGAAAIGLWVILAGPAGLTSSDWDEDTSWMDEEDAENE